MKDPNKRYTIPEFLLSDESGKAMSDLDLKEIERICEISAAYKYPKTKTDAAWNAFANQIQPALTVTKRPVRFAMFRWVAAAVVVLTLGLGVWQYQQGRVSTYSASIESELTKKSTVLPDGSKLELNTGTVLLIRAINAHKRILELKKGEIFVDVVHNELPFKIITDKGIVTVMGTSFNIKHTQTSPFAIFLKTGSIQFETADSKIVLKPGDYLEEDPNGDFIISKETNKNPIAWSDGKLAYDNSTLSDIIKGLEDLYKVKFQYDSNLASEKLTITFENLSAEQAAQLLSKTLRSQVTIVEQSNN